MMGKRINSVFLFLQRSILVVFIVLFAIIWFFVTFIDLTPSVHWGEINMNTTLLLLLTFSFVVLLFFIYNALKKANEKHGKYALIVFMVFSTTISIVLSLGLRHDPVWDQGAVFHGAIDWVLTGSFEDYHGYFAAFPHNIPLLFLFRCVFSVLNFFGRTGFYPAAVLFTIFLLQLSVLAIYDTVNRLIGVRGAIMSIVLIAIYLPFYTMGAAFYTHVLTLPFVAFTLNFYLRTKSAENKKSKIIYSVFLGIIAAIGSLIAATVIITFIACILDWILNNKDWNIRILKDKILTIGISIFTLALVMFSFQVYYRPLIDEDLVHRNRWPTVAWIYIGLTEESGGTFTNEAGAFVGGHDNVDNREREIMAAVENRIRDFGTADLLRHLATKNAVAYRSGTFDQAWHLGAIYIIYLYIGRDDIVLSNPLHEMLLPLGEHYQLYNHISTAIMLAYIIFALVGAILSIKKPVFCVPWLAFIGMSMYLTVFETGNRHPTSLFSILIVGALLGLSGICGTREKSGFNNSDSAEIE